jgi:hypothetical protein
MTAEGFAVHQEPDDAPARTILRIAAVGVAVGGAGVVVAGALLIATTGSLRASGARVGEPPEPSGPIEQSPVRDVQRGVDLARAQRRTLEGWGWVDRRDGIARIPIESAMDLVVQRSP